MLNSIIFAILFFYIFDVFGVIIAVGISATYPYGYMHEVAHYLFWICLLTLIIPVLWACGVIGCIFKAITRNRTASKYQYDV